MSWLNDLFGGGSKQATLPPAPTFQSDPNYTAQMSFLQPYSIGLLSGNNIPDFYKSIAEQNSPEFQKALGVSNAAIGQAAAEGAARAGTGRGGQLPQVTAQQVGNNTAALTYQDFLNSNAGKQSLLGVGQNVSNSVLNASLQNQGQQNSFNLNAYNDQNAATEYNNKVQAGNSDAFGSMLGTLIPAATTIGGGIVGGAAGASVGQTIGSALGGNTSSIADLFKLGGNTGSAGTSSSGTSDLGSITPSSMSSMNTNDLMQYFNLN